MIFCIYTLTYYWHLLIFSWDSKNTYAHVFFSTEVFSFLFHFFFHWNIYNSYLAFVLYSSHYFILFVFFSWLLSFVFSTDLLGCWMAFSTVSEGRVGDRWFNSVLLTPSRLMLQLVGIPPWFSKIFSHYLVPKPAFTFLCLQGYFMRNLKKIKFIKKKLSRLSLPCRISHYVNLEVI